MSEKKYHINPASGKAGVCTATKRPCRYGSDAPHYSSSEEAQADFSRTMEAEGSVIAEPVTKGMSRLEAMEARVAYVRERKREIREVYEARGVKCATGYEAIGRKEAAELNRGYQEYAKLLTKNEIDAFHEYTGILYQPINKILQGANIQNWVESAQVRIKKMHGRSGYCHR